MKLRAWELKKKGGAGERRGMKDGQWLVGKF